MKLYKDEWRGRQGTAEKGLAEAECACARWLTIEKMRTHAARGLSPTTPSEPLHPLDCRREVTWSGIPISLKILHSLL